MILVLFRHSIEFFLGGKLLPYNMTIFQAIKQFGLVSGHVTLKEVWPVFMVTIVCIRNQDTKREKRTLCLWAGLKSGSEHILCSKRH